MALATNEVMTAGFVRDTLLANALVVTNETLGAQFTGGFLRDPDGRLVVLNA